MTTEVPHSAGNTAGNTADSPERIKAEIERTRQQLGDAVELLVARADLKRRARSEVGALTGRVSKRASTVRKNPVPLAVAVGLVLAAVSLTIWQRTRQHGKGA